MTIEELEKSGMLAYKFLRGSWSHGIGVEGKSDYDYGGVFIAPLEMILGLRSNYQEQVSDAKNDETYYEFGRWIELLLKSNPTALESLYIDKKFVIGDVHPAVQQIIDNRDYFLTKESLNPIYFYSLSQVHKSRGLNKKIVNPVTDRKDILDFCYTFKKQGSQPIKDFIKEHHLDQKYCGLVNIPNMKDVYGVYYDFAAYFKFEGIDWYRIDFGIEGVKSPYSEFISEEEAIKIKERIKNKEFFGYPGIVHPDDIDKSNDVRLCSIPKGELPICFMTYNKDAYTCHCRDYKDYKEWEEKRNPVRYESNLHKNYDAKNMCETIRLIHTGIEVARDGVFNVERTWDRDFLLDVKNHKYEYDEIMKYVEEKQEEFNKYYDTCKLPEHIDYNQVNRLLIESRKKIYQFS